MLKTIGSNLKLLFTNERNFWSRYNVTLHERFSSREESLAFFEWRNSQNLFYEQLMPTAGFDGRTILDYGCGPCHDIVGFVENSKPRRVVGLDISEPSLNEGSERLSLHGAGNVQLKHLDFDSRSLPFSDGEFDYIHSSGVLHHVKNIESVLREFRRILKLDGFCRIMVYHYDSIWLHLYAAYVMRIKGERPSLSLDEAFKMSTDTRYCPISRAYKPEQFILLCREAGFSAELLGCAISVREMAILDSRIEAIQNRDLEPEHREFLRALEFDKFGRPLSRGQVAGLDACYELKPA